MFEVPIFSVEMYRPIELYVLSHRDVKNKKYFPVPDLPSGSTKSCKMSAPIDIDISDESPLRKFSSERHAKKILNELNENRKLQRFCDGLVLIGDRQLYVQRGVLAAASHYFR